MRAEILTKPGSPIIGTVTEVLPDNEVRVDLDAGGDDFEGWFCVATDPYPCPAVGCDFVALQMTAAHRTIVWEEGDDPNLLRLAACAKDFGRNPRVTPYEKAMGPAIDYYRLRAEGSMTHGTRWRGG